MYTQIFLLPTFAAEGEPFKFEVGKGQVIKGAFRQCVKIGFYRYIGSHI